MMIIYSHKSEYNHKSEYKAMLINNNNNNNNNKLTIIISTPPHYTHAASASNRAPPFTQTMSTNYKTCYNYCLNNSLLIMNNPNT